MKKLCSILLVLAFVLAGCTARSPSEPPPEPDIPAAPALSPSPSPVQAAEYIKITPREARDMMSGDVVILDVRTQEEYDGGHIENAVLLPDYEIGENADNVLTDKNQTVLVYCRTGIRSERASKELIAMGYIKVYDFGGIADWPGEIVGNGFYSSYYNYYGQKQPPDIVTPIDLTVSQQVHKDMPAFAFHLIGTNTKSYRLSYEKDKYYIMFDTNSIDNITITDQNGGLVQEISGFWTENTFTEETMYGLSFDDWNFDGYTDISLSMCPGGSMLNAPHYYWLWDAAAGEFVSNAELEDASWGSSLYANPEAQQVCGITRNGGYGSFRHYYEYRSGSFTVVRTWEVLFEPVSEEEGEYIQHTIIRELVDGELVVTEESYGEIEW